MTNLSPDALGVLTSEQSAKLIALFRRMGLAGIAEDLVQDTYEKALKSIKTFRGDSQASTWLYRVAQSVALDHIRRQRRSPVLDLGGDDEATSEILQGVDHGGNPEAQAIARQRLEQICAAIDLLPRAAREVFEMGDEVIVDDAARGLGTSRSAIHSRMSRLRKKLLNETPE